MSAGAARGARRVTDEHIRGRDDEGQTPLHVACHHGHAGPVRSFMRAPVVSDACFRDVNARGETPLFIACDRGHLDVVRTLLDTHDRFLSSTVLNAADSKERTPLMAAAAKGHAAIVQELLRDSRTHESRNAMDLRRETALSIACRCGHASIAKELLDHTSPRLINAMYPDGKTLLHMACAHQNASTAAALLANPRFRNATVDEVTYDGGDTALVVAASHGATSVVEALLRSRVSAKHRRSLDVVRKNGATVLHHAATAGYATTLKVLLESDCVTDATVNARTREGATLRECAQTNGHADVLAVLDACARYVVD